MIITPGGGQKRGQSIVRSAIKEGNQATLSFKHPTPGSTGQRDDHWCSQTLQIQIQIKIQMQIQIQIQKYKYKNKYRQVQPNIHEGKIACYNPGIYEYRLYHPIVWFSETLKDVIMLASVTRKPRTILRNLIIQTSSIWPLD